MRNMATHPLSDLLTERAVTREKLGVINASAAVIDHEDRALYRLGDLQHLLAKNLPPSANPLEAEDHQITSGGPLHDFGHHVVAHHHDSGSGGLQTLWLW
jgi:hypothetical protein